VRAFDLADVFRRAGRDDLATTTIALWAEVDDSVGAFNHVAKLVTCSMMTMQCYPRSNGFRKRPV
jgi:hypothetical protein